MRAGIDATKALRDCGGLPYRAPRVRAVQLGAELMIAQSSVDFRFGVKVDEEWDDGMAIE